MRHPAPPCNEGHIRMEGMSHRHVLKLEAKVIFYFILPYVVLVVYLPFRRNTDSRCRPSLSWHNAFMLLNQRISSNSL